MENFIQFGNFRVSLFILPEFILAGIAYGFAVDELGRFHKCINIGLIFVTLAFMIIDEEAY